jgi:hypothetical protein
VVNKKYSFLDDLANLKAQRLEKSMATLAEEYAQQTGISKATLAACIRFREIRYFTKEERSKFKKDRKFHQNKKKPKS